MKNKLQLNNKISLKQKLVYAGFSIGLILIVCTLGFFYLNVGNTETAMAATYRYKSQDNKQGLWNDESAWTKSEAWMGPRPILGTYFTANVLGVVTYNVADAGSDFRISNGTILDVTDTLIIKGDAIFTSANGINVLPTGVLVILGNLSISGGTPLNIQGRVVVTENITATGSGRIQNSATGTNGFYSFGNRTQNGGGNTGNNHRNKTQLQNIDPTLYDLVMNGGIILLPIVLDYFSAELSNDKTVNLKWGTISEKENDFFTLERSNDGKIFEFLTNLDGAGNSLNKKSYQFEDKSPETGMNYYRLKQTDFNGDFEYFKIVGVNKVNETSNMLSSNAIIVKEAYPNPFKNEVKLDFEVKKAENIKVIIQNARGEVLYQEAISVNLGTNNYTFTRADELKSGIYYINLKSDSENFKPQRIVKL